MTKEEFLKEKLNKEELQILLKNQVDEYGNIDLKDLDFRGCTVYLNRLKADRIINGRQKAKKNIYNGYQEADGIQNYCQQSNKISNGFQKAKRIDNDNQTITKN